MCYSRLEPGAVVQLSRSIKPSRICKNDHKSQDIQWKQKVRVQHVFQKPSLINCEHQNPLKANRCSVFLLGLLFPMVLTTCVMMHRYCPGIASDPVEVFDLFLPWLTDRCFSTSVERYPSKKTIKLSSAVRYPSSGDRMDKGNWWSNFLDHPRFPPCTPATFQGYASLPFDIDRYSWMSRMSSETRP